MEYSCIYLDKPGQINYVKAPFIQASAGLIWEAGSKHTCKFKLIGFSFLHRLYKTSTYHSEITYPLNGVLNFPSFRNYFIFVKRFIEFYFIYELLTSIVNLYRSVSEKMNYDG